MSLETISIETSVGLIALLGVIVSAITSILVTRIETKKSEQSTKLQLEKDFSVKLYERRLEAYPVLYSHLGEIGSLILSKNSNKDDYINVWQKIIIWDQNSAIFLSPFSTMKQLELRRELSKLSSIEFVASRNWQSKKLMPKLIEMQKSLKTELGVFNLTEYHSPTETKTLSDMLHQASHN